MRSSAPRPSTPAAVPAQRQPKAAVPLAARVMAVLLAVTAAAPFPGSGPIVFGLALASFGYAVMAAPLVRPHWTILVFMGWCALTLGWSVAPGQTLRGVLVLVASTLAVCSLAAQLPRAQMYRALSAAFKMLIILSWLVYVALPATGREQEAYHRGALTGVFIQRNAAAFVLAIAVLTYIFMAASPLFNGRARSATWAILALVTLVATESGTGLAVTVICALMMVGACRTHRWSRFAKRSLLTVLAGVAGVVALNAQSVVALVTGLLGRDATLTGRTLIWSLVEPYLRARPWLGYGWSALWTKDTLMTRAMWSKAGFDFPHAHNAYLDVLAQCGIIGLVLIMLVFAAVLVKAGAGLLSGQDGLWPAWPLVVVLCLLLYGISEQSFTGYFGWLVVVLGSVLVRAEVAPTAGPAAGAHEPDTDAVDAQKAVTG